MENALQKAIDIVGGQTALAKAIGGDIQQPHVWNWLNRSNGIPPHEYCASIEKATNGQVTRKDFYPKTWHLIWPELAGKDAA